MALPDAIYSDVHLQYVYKRTVSFCCRYVLALWIFPLNINNFFDNLHNLHWKSTGANLHNFVWICCCRFTGRKICSISHVDVPQAYTTFQESKWKLQKGSHTIFMAFGRVLKKRRSSELTMFFHSFYLQCCNKICQNTTNIWCHFLHKVHYQSYSALQVSSSRCNLDHVRDGWMHNSF